ncbi:hypothetical protein N8700_05495 [Candidatus Pelagibacter sp.]|nr:hypothetical protein [Candidatus Pelagibacter sp.]|tara:strand:+ start:1349 stop:1561 length:213 start_codon:yes stop_codon:yes gene_type:complete
MYKINQDKNTNDSGLDKHKNLKLENIKTTNINILLNRVKMNKKNDFKKKLSFFSILILGLVIVTGYSYFI